MERLKELVGREQALQAVSQALHFAARSLTPPAAGALQITCADESEHECVQAFQQGFVQYMLPSLKFARHAPMRLANLGGRYEWGAVRIAESHFATEEAGAAFKLLVIKINSHVAYEELSDPVGETTLRGVTDERPFRLGIWKRYGMESACCGAMAAVLHDGQEPFSQELEESFSSEGVDRLGLLLDETKVDPLYRPLFASIVSARLQARKVTLEIQDYSPVSPTYFLVLPAVTINRHERDTEILVGQYVIDGRRGGREAVYYGLGDDPSAFEIESTHRLFTVTDENVGRERMGRNHRALVREEWRKATAGKIRVAGQDERLARIRHDVARNKHRNHHHARSLLRAALPILAEVAPIPAAILLFADGAAGIHHAFRVHKLARDMEGSHEARQILDEIEERVDRMDPERAEALIEMLVREYSG